MKGFLIFIILSVTIVLIAYISITIYLTSYFEISSYQIEKLGHMGSFFNVITALTSVITVCLVSYAVYLQKKELKEMKEQMKKQEESLRRDERINRTIKLINEWLNIYELTLNRDKEKTEYIEKFIHKDFENEICPQVKFIDKIIYYSDIGGELSKFIDFNALRHAMIENGLLNKIEYLIEKRKNSIKFNKKILKNPAGYSENNIKQRKKIIKVFENSINNFESRKKFLMKKDKL